MIVNGKYANFNNYENITAVCEEPEGDNFLKDKEILKYHDVKAGIWKNQEGDKLEYPQSEIEVITLKRTEEVNSLNVANYSLEAEVDSKKLAYVNFVVTSDSFQIISRNIKNGIITCEFRTAIDNQKITIQAINGDKNIIAEKTVDLPQKISEDDNGTNYILNIDTFGEGTITPGEIPFVNLPEMVEVRAGTTSPDNGDLTLAYDIEMGKYEVTHAQYIKFLNDVGVTEDGIYDEERFIVIVDMYDSYCAVGYGSSFYFAGSDYAASEDTPVIFVTWYGALAYCNWLSEKEGLTPAYDLNDWELNNSDVSTFRAPKM